MLYTTQPGGFYGGGIGNEGAMRPPAVRFDPSQLNVQPGPGYMNSPNYSPFRQGLDRDRFILHDPRSGVAGNPFGPSHEIPGKKPGGQPVLPGESKEAVEGVYGRPGPQPMPGTSPLGLPMAMGSSNLPNAIGNMAGMANSQFYRGPQLGQAGLYFGGVM
jgi:hypothetical protein